MSITAKVKRLVKELDSPKQGNRLNAVDQLGRMMVPEAKEALFLALKNSDQIVRIEAAKRTGKDQRTIDALLELMTSKQNDIRKAAIDLLALLGDQGTVEPLIEALYDEKIRKYAADALAKLHEPKWKILLEEPETDNEVICSSEEVFIRRIAKTKDIRIFPIMIRTLKSSKDSSARKRAVKSLGELEDKRAVDPLIHVLSGNNTGLQIQAAKALEKLKDTRAVEPLILLLMDENEELRRTAALCLFQFGETKWDPLVKCDPEDFVRLLEIQDPRLPEGTEDFLKSQSPIKRTAALKWMVKSKDTNAIYALIEALTDKEDTVRQEAVNGLCAMEDPRVTELLDNALLTGNSDLVAIAAEALGRLKDPCSIEPLTQALEKKKSADAVADALVVLGALDPLLKALGNEDRDICSVAARALGNMGNSQAIDPLIKKLKDRDLKVSKAATEALIKLKDLLSLKQILDLLNTGLETKIYETVQIAAEVLARMNGVSTLEQVIKKNPYDCEDMNIIINAAAKMRKAADPYIDMLVDVAQNTRKYAAETLRKLNEPEWAEIISVCDNSYDRDYFTLLKETNDPRIVLSFIHALKVADDHQKTFIAELLGDIGDIRAVNELENIILYGNSSMYESGFTLRKEAALALIKIAQHHKDANILTAEIIREIQKPHEDGYHNDYPNSDCSPHEDTGIGINMNCFIKKDTME